MGQSTSLCNKLDKSTKMFQLNILKLLGYHNGAILQLINLFILIDI